VAPSLVLLVSLLSVYLYQTAAPQITEVSTGFCTNTFLWLLILSILILQKVKRQ
jgi:uncharacterized membrane protein